MPSRQQSNITTHQMLPVFKVISDLEDPKLSNFSISISPERDSRDASIPIQHKCSGSRSVSGIRSKRRKRMVRMDAVGYALSGNKYLKHRHSESAHKCKKHSNCKLKRNDDFTPIYPEKLNFSANFTPTKQFFDIKIPKNRERGLFNRNHNAIELDSENPIYEVPNDTIRVKKSESLKSRGSTMDSDGSKRSVPKYCKSLLKDQRNKLTQKYEGLIVKMMDRCEEDMLMITEKDTLISRMKDKLKSLHHINQQFSDQHEGLLSQQLETRRQLEQYQQLVYELEQRNTHLEVRLQDQAPVREDILHTNPNGPSVVQICMSCATKDILLRQAQEHVEKTQQDLVMMKNIVYRLNVQLSRYQDRIREIHTNTNAEKSKTSDMNAREKVINFESAGADRVSIPSMALFGNSGDGHDFQFSEDLHSKEKSRQNVEKPGENWGDVNSHTLAPLLNAYQESINEKDSLIQDYEKQFNIVTLQLKQALLENTALRTRSDMKEKDLKTLHGRCKELMLEKDKAEQERDKLLQRTETAEVKVKEVYEAYEDKVSALMRDYETVHREYFTSRSALATTQARLQALEGAARLANQRTVPADMHERRIEDCKRLFEELKFQYSMEKEKTQTQLRTLQEQKTALESQVAAYTEEVKRGREELKQAQKDARLYRRAAVVFRSRLRIRAKPRSVPHVPKQPDARIDMQHIQKIRQEIQNVKQGAHRELSEMEICMQTQQRQAAQQKAESEREVGRLQLLLEHKERIVRHLIEKVAAMEPDSSSDPDLHLRPSFAHPEAAVPRKARKDSLRLSQVHDKPYPFPRLPGAYVLNKNSQTLDV